MGEGCMKMKGFTIVCEWGRQVVEGKEKGTKVCVCHILSPEKQQTYKQSSKPVYT